MCELDHEGIDHDRSPTVMRPATTPSVARHSITIASGDDGLLPVFSRDKVCWLGDLPCAAFPKPRHTVWLQPFVVEVLDGFVVQQRVNGAGALWNPTRS